MAVTDAAMKLLLGDYRAAKLALDADKVTLDAAEAALAAAIRDAGETVVKINAGLSVRVRLSADGAHVLVDPIRSVV
jgi:hypothetical protein